MIKGDIQHSNDENSSDLLESNVLVKDATWTEVFKYKQPLVIGCGLMAFQVSLIIHCDSLSVFRCINFTI